MRDLLPSLSWLQGRCETPHFFGLGFIQVKVSLTERYHFYHRSLPAFVEEPHDHRYDFTARVLKGRLHNTLYHCQPLSELHGATGSVFTSSCKPEQSTDTFIFTSKSTVISSFVTSHGEWYSLHSDTMHTAKPMYDESDSCITHLIRGVPHKENAHVFRSFEHHKVCPFSMKIDKATLWEKVRICLET